MRRHRDRRRRGFRCATVEVSPTDAAVLVEQGLLERGDETDLAAIERAIGAALERLAGYP
jgi:hypothetical protein